MCKDAFYCFLVLLDSHCLAKKKKKSGFAKYIRTLTTNTLVLTSQTI